MYAKNSYYKKEGAEHSNGGLHYTSCLLTLSGCQEEALGMENGRIPDSAIKANYQVNQEGQVKIPKFGLIF